MKNIKNTMIQTSGKLMAQFALNSSKIAANSKCVCIYHQPKMPSEVMKLRKK